MNRESQKLVPTRNFSHLKPQKFVPANHKKSPIRKIFMLHGRSEILEAEFSLRVDWIWKTWAKYWQWYFILHLPLPPFFKQCCIQKEDLFSSIHPLFVKFNIVWGWTGSYNQVRSQHFSTSILSTLSVMQRPQKNLPVKWLSDVYAGVAVMVA